MTKNRPQAGIRMSKMNDADTVIIGGGPAGLSAAVWCSDLSASVILLEKEADIGGQLRNIYNPINNYLGRRAANGAEMLLHFRESIEQYKFLRRVNEEVIAIDTKSGSVQLGSGDVIHYGSLIIATGVRRRSLNIPGEFEFRGKGVHESGARDKENMAGKHVLVVGGGDAAVENALLLAEVCPTVTLVHRGKRLGARREFVERMQTNHCVTVFTESVVDRIIGNEEVEAVEIRRNDAIKPFQMAVRGVLIRIGVEPNTDSFRDQLQIDAKGYIVVTSQQETTVPNVFAIGDVSNPLAPTLSGAIGAGATAAKVIASRLQSGLRS